MSNLSALIERMIADAERRHRDAILGAQFYRDFLRIADEAAPEMPMDVRTVVAEALQHIETAEAALGRVTRALGAI